MNKEDFTLIGHIAVDSGTCWIGDPCYVLTPDAKNFPARSWNEFCDILKEKEKNSGIYGVGQWNFNRGVDGLGVTTGTGYGDGFYPVYAILRDGVVGGVFVDFMGILD